jgi:hypothetical protein
LGAAATVIAAALAGYSLAYAGELTPPAALLTGLGLFFVLLAVVFRARFAVAAGLLVLAAEYVLIEVTDRVPAVSIAGYAVGLVVLAELLLWSEQLPSPARMEVAVLTRWLQGVALTAAAAAGLALIVLTAAGFHVSGAFTGTVGGAAAAAVLLALPWLLVRRGAVRRGRARD